MCVFKIIFGEVVFQDVCKGESAAMFFLLWCVCVCVFFNVMLLPFKMGVPSLKKHSPHYTYVKIFIRHSSLVIKQTVLTFKKSA